MPITPEAFFQYSSGIADASYVFDFPTRVTIAGGGNAIVTFPAQAVIIRIRSLTIADVTASVGGTAPALIACYYRIDGRVASATAASDGSTARIVKPAERQSINRFIAQENGVTIFNPNAGSVTLQVELGA